MKQLTVLTNIIALLSRPNLVLTELQRSPSTMRILFQHLNVNGGAASFNANVRKCKEHVKKCTLPTLHTVI